ncbi:Pentatricopeptide repeat-containing protein, chloroplastic [Symbiodinium microadriaticum]|uniref:Pentatricopeptide repeat-containing protein, chloroplastic n=1 Tax=Symbiodinium microadriaticum TaxID=2951 RepID=A0A1Q9F0C9_SYMMI|nr:Pentatricopeptide repeat-containing protein, chloroplastic [Symbiodinium microadriaticum]
MAFLRLSLTSVGLSARIGSGRNRLAATAADGKSDEVTFQVCMVGCGRAHAWPLALRFFQDMASFNVKQTTAGCNAAMAACEKGHAWEIALRLLEFEDLVDTPSYNSAISACGKGRQWRWALVLEGDMTEKELVPDAITHNSLMTALERGAQWQRALREIAAAQVPSNVAYNAAISSCGSSIMWRHALGLLHELRQRKGAGLVAFNAAMTSCAKGRHVREALQLFDEIQATDLQPDIVSFGAALTACEKGGLWEEAIYILLVRLQAAKVKPNVVLLNAVASACEKGRHWPGALWILHQAACRHRLRPDGTTINAAMAACLRGDQWPRALTLFAEMRRLSLASLTSYSEGLLSLQQTPLNYALAKQVYTEDPAKKDMTVDGMCSNAFYGGATSLSGSTNAVWHGYIIPCLDGTRVCTADTQAAYAWDESAAFYIGNVDPVIGDGYTGSAPGNLYSIDFPDGILTSASNVLWQASAWLVASRRQPP